METIWLCLIALMIGVYVVLDGFDIGAGIAHFLVARGQDERRLVLKTIGPVWDGNEVWLLAAGGTLYFAFPAVYAAGFSGFYLPLMILLWLLILRGISIEFRNHIVHPVWIHIWDMGFAFSSILVAIFLGAALGNVVRGVPLDATGYFFEPLWTDFRVGPATGILDWYTILVGVAALFSLAVHGALWIAMKTSGPVQERARKIASGGWWPLALLAVLISLVSFRVQPQILANLSQYPWGYAFPALAFAGLLAMRIFIAPGSEGKAFLASCAAILGLLTSAVFGIYPYLLPARTNPEQFSLGVDNAGAHEYGLRIGFVWWTIGMVLAIGYFVFVYRHFRGKVKTEEDSGGY